MDNTEFEQVAAPELVSEQENGDLANGDTKEEAEPLFTPRGLYLIRIPKPPVDDSELKRLQADFQAAIAKLKAMNGKLAAARDVVRGYKRQMGEARGLKETSEPEFQEKFTRMKELRTLRDGYYKRIEQIKSNLKGIDCKSEEELDERIRQIEHRMAHEGMSLRDEKMAVQQIAKLNGQRAAIREFEGQKSTLAELESECSKVKQIIAGMESEFDVIRTERQATQEVVKDISGSLKKAQEDLAVLEAEQAELVAAKEAALKALDSTRDDTNSVMQDYRENRKLSLTVRDLVAEGRAEEAQPLIAAQVDEWISKLASDAALRKEYYQRVAAQRKYLVSELLPESSTQAAAAAATAKSAAGKQAGGKKGAKDAAPAKPTGAEKAKSIIEQLLQEASAEAAAAKARGGAGVVGGSDGDGEDDNTPAPVPVKAAAEPYRPPGAAAISTKAAEPAKLVVDPAAAAAAAFNFKVELPKVADEVFVPPVIRDVENKDAMSKEAIRQEQAKKAAEAEERKRRRAEAAERKRQQAAEAARRLEAERRERDAAARAAAAASKADAAQAAVQPENIEALSGPDQQQSATEATATTTAVGTATAPTQRAAKPQPPKPFEKRAAAKRPKVNKNDPVRLVKSIWNQYQGPIIFGVVMLLVLILAVMFLF